MFAHLRENRMTYLQHFQFAMGHAAAAFLGSAGLAVHAVLPCLFVKAGATLATRLYRDFTIEEEKKMTTLTLTDSEFRTVALAVNLLLLDAVELETCELDAAEEVRVCKALLRRLEDAKVPF